MEMDSRQDRVTSKETHMGVKERAPRGEKQALGREEWRYFVSNVSLDVDSSSLRVIRVLEGPSQSC